MLIRPTVRTSDGIYRSLSLAKERSRLVPPREWYAILGERRSKSSKCRIPCSSSHSRSGEWAAKIRECDAKRSLKEAKSPPNGRGTGERGSPSSTCGASPPGSLTIDGPSRGADGERSSAPTFHRGGHASGPLRPEPVCAAAPQILFGALRRIGERSSIFMDIRECDRNPLIATARS